MKKDYKLDNKYKQLKVNTDIENCSDCFKGETTLLCNKHTIERAITTESITEEL